MEAYETWARRASFDANGAITIPASIIKESAPTMPPLLLREWIFLIFLTAENRTTEIPAFIRGNKTTEWRMIRSLTAKGYLKR